MLTLPSPIMRTSRLKTRRLKRRRCRVAQKTNPDESASAYLAGAGRRYEGVAGADALKICRGLVESGAECEMKKVSLRNGARTEC